MVVRHRGNIIVGTKNTSVGKLIKLARAVAAKTTGSDGGRIVNETGAELRLSRCTGTATTAAAPEKVNDKNKTITDDR